MQVSTDLKHDLAINISFPGLMKNGSPINETINLVYNGVIPHSAQFQIDMVDVVGDFTNNGTTFNELVGDYQITITGTGNEIVGSENIQTEHEFHNLKYKNATGYFGQQSLGGYQDSILLKIFGSNNNGYFELTNPKLKLEMINSFGFPLDIMLSNLKTVNTNTGVSYPLTGYPTPISIASPANFGQAEQLTIELNTTNTTNITSIISPVPKYFHFEAAGLSNPAGQTSVLNFIEDTSKFEINAELELPLEGFAYGFTLTDTTKFSFTEDTKEIEQILFRFISNNGFPADLLAKITFVDENYTMLLELTNGNELVVESAETDANGKVNQSTEKISDFTVGKSTLTLLKQAKYIIINAEAQSLNGPDGEIVKFFDSYSLSLNIGMQVIGNFSL